MKGNVTREGISADLLAMKEAGIGGLIFMDGGLGNPPGPHRFMSASWLKLFSFLVEEAGRLGIEINLNNAPGWAGSGGPWIKPEQATQTIIVAKMLVEDASQLQSPLAKPAGIRHDYYRDIAILAFPASSSGTLPSFRIPGIATTKSFAGTGFIALDVYMGWDVPYTLRMFERLEKYRIAWIEEPVSPDDIGVIARYSLRKLPR
jgi:hypothetical protein